MSPDAVGRGMPRLFLSFWDLCLENLPIGRFERRRVPIDTARGLIHAAKAEKRLLCVTSKDLLAPYGVKHLRRYRELCGLFNSDYGIAVGVEDFMSVETEPPAVRCINPLQCVQLTAGEQMLIATCHYVMKTEHADIDRWLAVAPDSLQFDLIDAMAVGESSL
jgi:hypothetical protein